MIMLWDFVIPLNILINQIYIINAMIDGHDP